MNTLTVSLVTIMIPGVIMALIYDTYTQHKSWDSFRYILMSVVFGIATYLSMQAMVSILQLITGIGDTKSIHWRLLSIWSIPNEEKIAINPLEILLGGLCAIPLGLAAVYLSTKRTFHELLLRKGISNKYGDDNAFIRSVEIMHKKTGQCYVLLHENNMLIHGVISLYNENEKTQELGLLNATVLNSETGEILWTTEFIYISKEYGKMVIFENYIEVPNGKVSDIERSEHNDH
ncbi:MULTISPECIES: hypothetical protein [Enterobacteriaceae]|uniref:Uncharacterized protein n=1 Tax=Yokenella regensburgei TaxID=158877 RepID=A0AB38G1A0_9ENTR|nr:MULTISPECIES: hypothetical protein [Enterobacteriaceae]KFD23296.1 hypothetical protein GYRE_02391 [Yokenella regensburgei ATCC 49455]SQA65439.1 Uncharacterised protein [Yokenella regensburgei]SQA95890.1 Uncharacterised protein [Yokenella regensburgei]SUQ04015.1 Uncharacterised protein [Yokenella regensburgei]